MTEIWEAIKGYEGKYEVSNLGRVKSLSYRNKKEERCLKPRNAGSGYPMVGLWNEEGCERKYVHKLVAEAFIPNPNGYKEINHINETKSDNRAENLEWCTHAYNVNYGSRNGRNALSNPHNVPVVATLPNGDKEYYISQSQAERELSIRKGYVCLCVHGRLKMAGGRTWQVYEEKIE